MTAAWITIPDGSPFPVDNLPYGVFQRDREPPRVGVAIGESVLDLSGLDIPHAVDFARPSLNTFLARGRPAWEAVRGRLVSLLSDPRRRAAVQPHLIPRVEVRLRMPFEIGDYVDFYSSEQHARNAGSILRPGAEPLPPNWRHLPVGYHGRSGSVVVSGTPVRRPSGQRREPGAAGPSFGPTQRLDLEAEMGFVVGMPSQLGFPVPASHFRDHVFGMVVVNDWSARDIQAWEQFPLGPFLGKSFATSVSPWVVPLQALDTARTAPPHQDPEPIGHLRDPDRWALDVTLSISLNGTVVSRPPLSTMYWSPGQQLAHLTANGASLRTGDLYATGTVSGPAPEGWGSLLELTWNGERPLRLADGSERRYLEDGDTVSISAWAAGGGRPPIGFGEVVGTILPAAG